jgi:hypothetical protein
MSRAWEGGKIKAKFYFEYLIRQGNLGGICIERRIVN